MGKMPEKFLRIIVVFVAFFAKKPQKPTSATGS
jgi:hypothetical protein